MMLSIVTQIQLQGSATPFSDPNDIVYNISGSSFEKIFGRLRLISDATSVRLPLDKQIDMDPDPPVQGRRRQSAINLQFILTNMCSVSVHDWYEYPLSSFHGHW